MEIIIKNTILYGKHALSNNFCLLSLGIMRPQNKLNRGYGAECYDINFTEDMIKEIQEFFKKARKEHNIPPLVMRNSAEILRYTPGMKLDTHYDIPYCKDDFYPFVTVINLNEGYEGGLYFDCADLKIEGEGSIALAPSSFMHTHSVKEIKNGIRFSMLLDITYPEMLSKCTEPENWVTI